MSNPTPMPVTMAPPISAPALRVNEEDDEQSEADDERRVAADVRHELAGQQPGPDEDEDDAADPAPVAAATRRPMVLTCSPSSSAFDGV